MNFAVEVDMRKLKMLGSEQGETTASFHPHVFAVKDDVETIYFRKDPVTIDLSQLTLDEAFKADETFCKMNFKVYVGSVDAGNIGTSCEDGILGGGLKNYKTSGRCQPITFTIIPDLAQFGQDTKRFETINRMGAPQLNSGLLRTALGGAVTDKLLGVTGGKFKLEPEGCQGEADCTIDFELDQSEQLRATLPGALTCGLDEQSILSALPSLYVTREIEQCSGILIQPVRLPQPVLPSKVPTRQPSPGVPATEVREGDRVLTKQNGYYQISGK